MKTTRKALGALAVGLMGAGAVAACAPAAPTPPPTGGVTTTSAVEVACTGTGIIGPGGASPVGPIADQTVDIDVTLPASATDGESITIGVDVCNLVFAPTGAPGFVNLNSAGIIAEIDLAGANGPATVAANNFVGNGTSIDLNEAGATATVNTGTNNFETGQIRIQSGSTGFVCTPTGAGAVASIEV